MNIEKVNNRQQLERIASLAETILPSHYSAFLPLAHVRYFIDTYQTVTAMEKQLQEGFEYFLVTVEGTDAGYLGIEQQKDLLVLSKLYILDTYRGKGIGTALMKKLYEKAAEPGVSRVELFVVRENKQAIAFYTKEGFSISEVLEKEYGSGYRVTEYKMIKKPGN